MFGSTKEATMEALEKMVHHGKWDKIKKSYLESDAATRANLAKACAKSVCDDSSNVLMTLVESTEENVKIAALQSLAVVGNDHCVTRLQQMMASVPEDKKELRTEIQNTLQALRGKQ